MDDLSLAHPHVDHDVELIERDRITHVRDEDHARALLLRHARRLCGTATAADMAALERLARALARGELLLAARVRPRRLDPPGSSLIPRLAELARHGDDTP